MKYIAPAHGLPRDFAASLTPAEVIALACDPRAWLRPDQRIPDYGWRVWADICGRGWGKTTALAEWITHRVERHGHERSRVILMAPNEHRVRDVQVSALLAEAPPWFAAEEYKEGVRWPNGVRALPFTPESPERTRSENAMIAWLSEVVDWNARTRWEAWSNINKATRVGPYGGQIVVDTTSKPGNELIAYWREQNERDPLRYVIQPGTMYDNPILTREYLQAVFAEYGSEANRRYREEVLGEIFSEAAGALFTQARLNANRLERRREHYDRVLVGADPAFSVSASSDETGIIVAGSKDRDVDTLEDLSGKHGAEKWPALCVRPCVDDGAAGIVAETNKGGDAVIAVLKVAIENRGLRMRLIPRNDHNPFPERTPGIVYVREIYARDSKYTRAEGTASLDMAGRLHMVGAFPELETELVTFEPGVAESPNRYDALNIVAAELADLRRDSKERPASGLARDALTDLRGRLRRIGGRSARVL